MAYAIYKVGDIQSQLDECARAAAFPALDNVSMYLADVRLHAFRDGGRWALIIEQLGYIPEAGGHNGINNCLYCYGNCLSRPPGLEGEDFLTTTSDGLDGPTFDETGQYVNPDAKSILARGNRVPLTLSPAYFATKRITLEDPPRIKAFELLRSLLPEYRTWFLATEDELAQRVPADLPCILTLDQWNHPNVNAGVLPSASMTFRMIAKVLVSGDKAFYQQQEMPNTHWKHWLGGGRG